MEHVNYHELTEMLGALKSGTIVNLVTNTEVRMKKTGNPYASDAVIKHSTKRVQFGYSYENVVNSRLEKQGLNPVFESQPLRWGTWYKNMINRVIEHNGKLYARFYLINNNVSEDVYFINGKMATAKQIEVVKKFEYSKSVSNTQTNVGLETNHVHVLQPCFDNIQSISVNGEIYIVKP